MVARKPGRYLAPVALIAVAVAVGLLVSARVQGHHSAPARASHHTATARQPNSNSKSKAKPKPKFYVIKPGDSLSSISVKTGVTITTLESLNPSINPAALQSGQRLRLRP